MYEFLGWMMFGGPALVVAAFAWAAVEERRAWRRRESLPPDAAQLRALADDLERLSQRVASFASRSESAEKEHASVT